MSEDCYFRRIDDATFEATERVGGAWALEEQHIAPALGVLAYAVETDHAARGGTLRLSRLSYDILGTLPVERVEVAVEVLRPGRTIELVEATLTSRGRIGVRLRAWLLQPGDTTALAGSDLPTIPGPHDTPAWDPTTVWPGGFIESVEVRRAEQRPGRATAWVRTGVPLLDVEVGPTARVAGLVDIANGLTVRASPREVAFPNLDLTLHLLREPAGEWVGFDTTVSFGGGGIGLTSSVLHDLDGPFATMAQSLTVRPS